MPIYRPTTNSPFTVQSPYAKKGEDITGQQAAPGQFAGGSTSDGGQEAAGDPNYAGIAERDPSLKSTAREEYFDPRTGAVAIRDTELRSDRGTVDVKSPFGDGGFARKDLGTSTARWGGLNQQGGEEVTSAGSAITQKAPTVLNYVMANRGKELGRAESLGLASRGGAGEAGLDRALEERQFGFTGEEQAADYAKWRNETEQRMKADSEKARTDAQLQGDAQGRAAGTQRADLYASQAQGQAKLVSELDGTIKQMQAEMKRKEALARLLGPGSREGKELRQIQAQLNAALAQYQTEQEKLAAIEQQVQDVEQQYLSAYGE